MSKFTDRLWQELMREHGAKLGAINRPAAARRRVLPRLLAGTSVGLAGAGTAIALAIGAASSTPAFAVTKNPDGTVSVTINKLAGVAGANARLAQMNVRAVAVPVEAGCEGAPPPAMLHAIISARAAAAKGGTVRIDPHQIPAGKSLVLAAGPGRVNIAQLHRGKSWTAPSCFRGIVGPVVCSAGGPPPGFESNTTDTSGTDTAPPPPTNATTTGTTTTGATTTGTTRSQVQAPSSRFAGCPPPCALAPPAANTGPTDTTTTGTTTAPATGATTDTTTTDTTGTTGTSTSPIGPASGRTLACAPPPCAVAQGVVTGNDDAALAKARAALAKARSALAADRRHAAKH
jgi:hypothetical protein